MIRLLIADDEALERETLADIVARRFEHEVTIETAENGRKAADTAVLWGADLILMDIEMPGMNGLDAARAVLEQRPECLCYGLQSVPVRPRGYASGCLRLSAQAGEPGRSGSFHPQGYPSDRGGPPPCRAGSGGTGAGS